MCLTELHPPLFHKHFGMEHLKFKSSCVAQIFAGSFIVRTFFLWFCWALTTCFQLLYDSYFGEWKLNHWQNWLTHKIKSTIFPFLTALQNIVVLSLQHRYSDFIPFDHFMFYLEVGCLVLSASRFFRSCNEILFYYHTV